MTRSNKITVTVVGGFPDPKTGKPVPIGDEIKVTKKTAQIGRAAGVFEDEGFIIGGVASPQNSALIESLREELAESQAYKAKIEGLLKAADITLDELAETLKPKSD